MSQNFDIGMVGLGVMGRNLLLNMADHGYSVIGLDKDAAKVQSLKSEGNRASVEATADAAVFLAGLKLPRAIVLLVPAGKPVDAVIAELAPQLAAGDLIIDSGNSHFPDTERRAKELTDRKLNFFGMGISGGESGARQGPSMMPGGPKQAYERVRPILEAVAAKVNGEPCVTYIGSGASGHYVKMVHNGIEYGIMQIIAEVYDLLHHGLGLGFPELAEVFDQWHKSELNSFLVEITAQVLRKKDPKTDKYLVEMILDVARAKGTGKWTSQEAMDQQEPLLTIDAAVSMRDLSAHETERREAAKLLRPSLPTFTGERKQFLGQLKNACHAATILTYIQGFALLRRADQAYKYGLDLGGIARIWRGGCIIRSVLLDLFRAAYKEKPDLANLLLSPKVADELLKRQADLRAVVRTAAELGFAAAGLMNSLAYFDAFRSARLPTNLIQAQRDFFGAHTYERIDEKGTFHTHWEE
jgi:6-phosphogluconate dehydrogenase